MTAFNNPHADDEDVLLDSEVFPTPPRPSPEPVRSPLQRQYQDDLCSLYRHELEEERNAAESAANEAISMIVRLQVEKAALQRELNHYQRLFETRSSYDQATITQLQEIISKQEEDKQALVRELVLYKHTLINDSDKNFGRKYPDWSTSFLCVDDPVSVDNRFQNNDTVTSFYKESRCDGMIAEVRNLETPGNNDEAKTKHVISFSVTSPMSKQYFSQWRGYCLEDLAMDQDTEYNPHKLHENCYSEAVEDRDVKTDMLQSDNISSNVCRHNIEKNSFVDKWNEAKTVFKGDLAFCESQLCVLEAARDSMIQALGAIRAVEKPETMLVMATDLLEECASFTNLGSNILTSLNKLIMCLKGLVQMVKEGKGPETTLESNVPKSERGAEEEKPESNYSTILDNSVITDVMDSGINKIAYLWSIGLEWMNDDRCRADTALSGWDH